MDGGRKKKKKEERRKRRRMNVDYNLIKKMFNFKLYRNNKEGRNNKISTHYYTEEDPGGPLCQVDRWTDRPLLLLLDRL